MHLHRHGHRPVLTAVLAAALAVTVVGCSSLGSQPQPSPGATDDAHGHVEGAEELSEPQLGLVFGGADGALRQLDLVAETETALLGPATGEVATVSGDGRFIFRVATSGAETTVEIVDSGVWTVEHGDHFHYYRAAPRTIGTLTGEGPAVIHTADRRTAITFPEMGEVVVVSQDDLEDGTIGNPARVPITPHPRAVAMPFGGALLTTVPDANGTPSTVQVVREDGDAVADPVACAGASGVVLTRVGVVFACETGAVLATETGDSISFEEIPYPAGVDAPAATSLQGRTGRPSVAGPAGDAGAWRLDSRARAWHFLPSETELVAVSAVADDADLTVAVDTAGRIRVFDAAGGNLAMTDPVLAESIANAESRALVRVIVDAQRAYVSDPANDRILEIDYRDNARIARTFPTPGVLFLEQVG